VEQFSFGNVERNVRKGTAKLTVKVPGPGRLELAKSKTVEADKHLVESEGNERLSVEPKGKARRRLSRRGRAKVKAEVIHTHEGGASHTDTKKVSLKKR